MSFPRYPAYKPSGVEWLGEVPEHWEITKTKHVTGFTTGWTPPTGDDSAYEGENLWANISDLGPRFLEDTAKRISDRAVAASRISPSPTGSLLFSFKLSIGQVSLAGRELYTNEAIATFHGSSRLLIPFAYHAFPLFLVQNATENIYGAKLLNQELIKAATFPLPPRAEQLAIATFLDRETAKIDALIAEQQRLIELLQEKRQAVISHAVTKGLNPDAPMKDSGVEWLGEVPEHWELRKVSQLFDGIGSGTTPKSDTVEYYEDGSIPWVVTGDLNDSYLHACHNRITDKAMAEHATLRLYPAGSVAVAMYGATIGKVSVLGFEATVNQACCVLPSSSNVLSGYLLGFILASRTHLLSLATGGGQLNINQEVIRSLRIPLPSLDEQVKIADHFAIAAAEFDSLLDLSAQQVLLLQERRSALISAAVTGQIDVRGLVPEVDQPMGLQPATTAGNI